MKIWKRPLILFSFVLTLVIVPLTALAASPLGHTRHAGHKAHVVAYIASVEGVTPAVLVKDLKAGKTLLQIAGTRYTSADALATALLARVEVKLNHAVAAGTISQAQAKVIYARLHARVAQLVTVSHTKLAMMRHRHGGKMVRSVKQAMLGAYAAACHTTAAAAMKALRAGGKTPLAICRTTSPNITKSALVARLVAAVKVKLDAAEATHPFLANHDAMILARVTQGINSWIVTALPVRG
jgi:hypothetical protein